MSAAPRLRILLVDDHPLVLAGIRTVLTRAAEFEVVGTATDGLQVLPLVEQTKPDVVLLDMRMPGLDWLACLTRIRVQYPDVVVVILSASTAAVSREAALAAGAAGYIHKDIDLNGLAAAVSRAIARARSGQSRARSGGALLDGLTEREILVLEQVSNGRGNREIAEALCISLPTVKFHLANIYRKLGVRNRTAAAQAAHSRCVPGQHPAAGSGSRPRPTS